MEEFEILVLPNPILRKKSKKVEKIDQKVKTTIKTMIGALDMSEIPGLGIAAPQIGENLRIIIVRVNEKKDEEGRIVEKGIPLSVFINPVITKFSREKNVQEEGCLSFPNFYGPVERAKKIRFEALTAQNKKVKVNASGFFARIVQHETDHLDGILFIDRLTDKSKLREIKSTAEVEEIKKNRFDGNK